MKTCPSIRRVCARTVLLIAGLGGGALGSGCGYKEGGNGYSADSFTYVSRSWQPWTITLRDTRTGQEVWTMDLPVGRKLAMQFYADEGTKDGFTPDLMKWATAEENIENFTLTNSIPVPPASVRRLEPTLRPVPELPESMVRATRGTVQPAKVPAVREPGAAGTGTSSGAGGSPQGHPAGEPPIGLPESK